MRCLKKFANDSDAEASKYTAIARVDKLPKETYSDARSIVHGYAVELGGSLYPTQWFFFHYREPAEVFGRAARTSINCTEYGVYRAAYEISFCDSHDKDERILHVAGEKIDRSQDEKQIFKRWVNKVSPTSSRWEPH